MDCEQQIPESESLQEKNEISQTFRPNLSLWLDSAYHLTKADFKESLFQMKLLITHQRQAQDFTYTQISNTPMELWYYFSILEIHLQQPPNISFLLILLGFQFIIAIFYGIIFATFSLYLMREYIMDIIYGFIIIKSLKLLIPQEKFELLFILQAYFYSLFLFLIYNNCLLFLFNLSFGGILEINNLINFFANYQFYYSFFKQISSLNVMKQSEYLLTPIGVQAMIFFLLSIMRWDYFMILSL